MVRKHLDGKISKAVTALKFPFDTECRVKTFLVEEERSSSGNEAAVRAAASYTHLYQINSHPSDGSVGVEHDSESGSHGAGREVPGELSADEAVVAVGSSDAAPDDSEFCVVSDALALEDVSDSLAKVEAGVLLIVHTLDLQEGELLRLSALASLESGEDCLGVESKRQRSIDKNHPYLTG